MTARRSYYRLLSVDNPRKPSLAKPDDCSSPITRAEHGRLTSSCGIVIAARQRVPSIRPSPLGRHRGLEAVRRLHSALR